MLVAHTCHPSYSGSRDQEDCGSKPAWGNSSRDRISKKPFTKNGWWSGSEFKAQDYKRKKLEARQWVTSALGYRWPTCHLGEPPHTCGSPGHSVIAELSPPQDQQACWAPLCVQQPLLSLGTGRFKPPQCSWDMWHYRAPSREQPGAPPREGSLYKAIFSPSAGRAP
jgi:hypothetical protein